MKLRRLVFLPAVFACVFFSSCEYSGNPFKLPGGKHFGVITTFGNGQISSFIAVNSDGNPYSLGITLSEAVLSGLGSSESSIALALPTHIQNIPFDHILVRWNPSGYPEQNISGPLFEVYAYTISSAQRQIISASDTAAISNLPPAQYVPMNFVPLKKSDGRYAGISQIGLPWYDSLTVSSSQSTNMFYGSNTGQFIFWNAFFTSAFLQSHQDISANIKMPQSFAVPGYYPTSYSIYYDAAHQYYEITFNGLTLF